VTLELVPLTVFLHNPINSVCEYRGNDKSRPGSRRLLREHESLELIGKLQDDRTVLFPSFVYESLDVVSKRSMTETSFVRSELQSYGVELLGVLVGVRADK
jgi:hypothetical protein